MKIHAITLACEICALLGQTAFAANFPLGTQVYTGTVLDYRHEARTARDELVVQAVATNGTVLASCKVTDPVVSTGVNFVLEVPVSTESSAKSAAIGDTLNCVVVSSSGATSVSTSPLPAVARANAISTINIVSAPSQAFSDGEKTVEVSDDYLAGIAPLMAQEGKMSYEPFADWDGDGSSNYEEYKAGTNPFDASDRLRITAFRPGGDATVLEFEYAGGHLYAVASSPSLTNETWSAESFGVGSATAARQQSYFQPGREDQDIGVATIYLAPASAAPSMFYTVRPE